MAPMGAGLTTRADRMFAEVDRQLLTLRTECDTMASRTGFLVSASAIATTLLSVRIPKLAASRRAFC